MRARIVLIDLVCIIIAVVRALSPCALAYIEVNAHIALSVRVLDSVIALGPIRNQGKAMRVWIAY